MTPVSGWPGSEADLIASQHDLADIDPEWWRPTLGALAIAACVVCFRRGLGGPGAAGDPAWAGAALAQERRVVCEATVTGKAGAPYMPGLLALREGPTLEAAARALALRPDVLLVDATGRDHPRRAGLAVHLGAVLELPTVGVTHRPLLARGPWPAQQRGAASPLLLDGEQVGAWLRTRAGARPVAVHAGWQTDVGTAIDVVLRASAGHRTPEVVRRARRLARTARARA